MAPTASLIVVIVICRCSPHLPSFVPGIESGGHGSASAPPVLNLLPQILSALPPSEAPPVLAAGGLSSGAHLAAFLTLGAAGAVVGTRFLVAEESQYSDAQKRAIIAAKSGSAVRSYVFDQLRDTTGWPAGVDGRGLAIPAVAAVESGGDITQIKEEVAEGTNRGDPRSVIAWAGTGVGPLTRLQPAKVRTGYLRSLCASELTARHNRISCGSYMKSLWRV